MSKTSQRKRSYYQLGYDDAKRYFDGRLLRRRHFKDYLEGYEARQLEMRQKRRGIISRLRQLFKM